jgi:multidrug efflux pump subunit AcrA (membrane-fusion protein)
MNNRSTTSRESIPENSGLSFTHDFPLGRSRFGGTERHSASICKDQSPIISNADIFKRPVTGTGCLARQCAATISMPTKVESKAYYSNLLHVKIDCIVREIGRLRYETEMADVTSVPRRKLDNEYKTAINEIRSLEATLDDLNLAKEKVRSGANNNDVHDEVIDILNHNSSLEKEIDDIFVARKRIESQTLKLESQLKQVRYAMEQKLIDDPEKLCRYQILLDLIDEMHAEENEEEVKMSDLLTQIKSMENDVKKSKCLHAKHRMEKLKHQISQLDADMELIIMDEHEARTHLLDRKKRIDKQQKQLENQSIAIQSEIDSLLMKQSQLRSRARFKSYLPKEDSTAIELLNKKDQEQKKFLAEMSETKSRLEEENKRLTASIENLQQEIDEKNASSQLELPSKEELKLMREEVEFTSKHLDSSKQTIQCLQKQKNIREVELEKINNLEAKIAKELAEIMTKTDTMRNEMSEFKGPEEVQASADALREDLHEIIETCTQKSQELSSLIEQVQHENEENKIALEREPNWKIVEVLKSKFKNQEQEIIKLKKNVDGIKEQNCYEHTKAVCLVLSEKINDAIVAKQYTLP